MSYHYKQTEFGDSPLYTVGTYEGGTWQADSDWPTKDEAAARVRYLNGGSVPECMMLGQGGAIVPLPSTISRRDWFAGMALTGLCGKDHRDSAQYLAGKAFQIADAMMEVKA